MKNTIILRRILIGGIFASLIVPFVVAKDLYFPFIVGKAYVFRVLVEVLFGLWLVLAIFDKEARPKKSCVLWSLISFLAIVLIANLLGTNPSYSFWSNYERMEGYITLLHLFAYFIVVGTIFNTQKIWNYFLNTLVVASVIQGFYALLQVSGKLKIGLSTDRIDGTFGNATYFAAFMLFSFFVTLFLFIKNIAENKFKKDSFFPYFYIIALILQIISVFLSATRGSIIALFAGSFVAVLVYAILEPKKKYLRWSVSGFLAVIILFVSVVFGFKESSFVQDTVSLRRISEISLDSGTVKARFINWGIAWNAIKERPLLGYGQGNYSTIFDTNYDVRMWNQEQYFDRVHNLFFDWTIAAGFIGLLSYLAIVASTLYYVWKPSCGFSNIEKVFITSFFAGYFIHTFFVFDSLTSYMILFLVFAYVHSRVAKDFNIFGKANFSKNIAQVLMIAIFVAIPFTVWGINSNSYFQNKSITNALKKANFQSDFEGARTIFAEGMNRRTFGAQEALSMLLDTAAKVVRSEGVDDQTKIAFIELSIQELDYYLFNNPDDSKMFLLGGQFFVNIGEFNLAIEYFQKAIEISPKKQFMYTPLILSYMKQGRNDEAMKIAKEVYEINPDNDYFWNNYIYIAEQAGDVKLSEELIEEAFRANRGNRVIELAEKNLRSNLNNPQAYASLAVTYYRLGDSERAIVLLEELSKLFPQSKEQTDLIINKIKAGEEIF